MNPSFFKFVQDVFAQTGARVEAVDEATFKLRIKRSHPMYEKLVTLFTEFQTRANTGGIEIQHLYKPGGDDRILELMREILGPEQHDRLVADMERERRRIAIDKLCSGAEAVVKDPQLSNVIAQQALRARVIPASALSTEAVNRTEALARGEKIE